MTVQVQEITKVPKNTRPRRTYFNKYGARILAIFAALLLWQAVTSMVSSPFFPPPSEVLRFSLGFFLTPNVSQLFLSEAIWVDAMGTMTRVLSGALLGILFGVLLGTAMGLWKGVREYLTPTVDFFRSVPASVSIPIFIILFGGGDDMRVIFIAWGCTWFVLINTVSGVAAVNPTTLAMASIFKVSRTKRFIHVILPSALPRILAGMRVGLTAALLIGIVSEFFLANNGIGFQLRAAQSTFNLMEMWSWIMLLGLIGYGMNYMLDLIEDRALRWHRMSRSN